MHLPKKLVPNIFAIATRRGVRTKAVVITMALVCTLFSGFALAGHDPSQYCSDGGWSDIPVINDPVTIGVEIGPSTTNPSWGTVCYSTTPWGSGATEVTGGDIRLDAPTQNGNNAYCVSDPAAMVRLDCGSGVGLNASNPTSPSASTSTGGQAIILGTPAGAGVQTGCNYGYTAGTGGVGCGSGGPSSRYSQWCADGIGNEHRVIHDPVTLDLEPGASPANPNYFQTCYSSSPYTSSSDTTGGVLILDTPLLSGTGARCYSNGNASVRLDCYNAVGYNTSAPSVNASASNGVNVLGTPVGAPSVGAGTGCANGTIAISTSSCAYGGLVAISGTGDAIAPMVSATGTGCSWTTAPSGIAASGTGCAHGDIVGASLTGCATSWYVAVGGGGGCTWGGIAGASGIGDAYGAVLGISGTGTANSSGSGLIPGVAISGSNAATGRDVAIGGGSGSGGIVGIGALETGSGSIASVSGGDAAVTVGGVTITDPCQQLPEACLVSIPINPIDDHGITPPLPFEAESVLSFIAESVPNPGAPGETSSTSSGGNPYGCKGRSDNPHISSHSQGQRVSAQGKTYCTAQGGVPYLFVESLLYRSRWYGWEKLDHKSSSCNGDNCRERYVNPSWACDFEKEHDYLIISYHKVRGWNGRIYDAESQKAIRLRC